VEEAGAVPRKPGPYDDCPRLPAPPPSGEDAPIDPRSLVAGETIEVEIGPGRGGFMFERAAAAPTAGLLGFEVRRKWATIVDRRLAKAGLGARARVFAEDAKAALPRLGPDGSIARFYVHFPDPWWKKRHTKRLVMGDVLVDQMRRLLAIGGELFVQSDVEERVDQYEELMKDQPGFVPAGDEPGSARMKDNPYEARSPREHRAIADGLPVHRLRYRRA